MLVHGGGPQNRDHVVPGQLGMTFGFEVAVFAQLAECRRRRPDRDSRPEPGELEGPPVGGASGAFWASWLELSRSAPPVAAGLDEPLLVVGGERDWNVTPDQQHLTGETTTAAQ